MNCCIVYLREGSDKSSRSRKVHGTNEECSLTRRRWWRRWRGLGQSVILSWGMTATFTSLLVISACLRLLPRMLIVCLQSLCLYIAMKSFHALLSSPRTRLSPKHAQPGVLTCTLQARPVPAARVQTRGSPQPLPPSPPNRRAAPVAAPPTRCPRRRRGTVAACPAVSAAPRVVPNTQQTPAACGTGPCAGRPPPESQGLLRAAQQTPVWLLRAAGYETHRAAAGRGRRRSAPARRHGPSCGVHGSAVRLVAGTGPPGCQHGSVPRCAPQAPWRGRGTRHGRRHGCRHGHTGRRRHGSRHTGVCPAGACAAYHGPLADQAPPHARVPVDQAARELPSVD